MFFCVYLLRAQLFLLRLGGYSGANSIPGITDHLVFSCPDETNARAAGPEEWGCRLLI